MDIWMLTCLVTVFVIAIECCLIGNLDRLWILKLLMIKSPDNRDVKGSPSIRNSSLKYLVRLLISSHSIGLHEILDRSGNNQLKHDIPAQSFLGGRVKVYPISSDFDGRNLACCRSAFCEDPARYRLRRFDDSRLADALKVDRFLRNFLTVFFIMFTALFWMFCVVKKYVYAWKFQKETTDWKRSWVYTSSAQSTRTNWWIWLMTSSYDHKRNTGLEPAHWRLAYERPPWNLGNKEPFFLTHQIRNLSHKEVIGHHETDTSVLISVSIVSERSGIGTTLVPYLEGSSFDRHIRRVPHSFKSHSIYCVLSYTSTYRDQIDEIRR